MGIFFSDQEGLSWQLHAFHCPATAFLFCALFINSQCCTLCTDMPTRATALMTVL